MYRVRVYSLYEIPIHNLDVLAALQWGICDENVDKPIQSGF